MIKSHKLEKRLRRAKRTRKKIRGTSLRPRLVVVRSLKHIYAIAMDDENGRVITSASSLSKEARGKGKTKKEKAAIVGKLIAKKLIERDINTVVFDRHGHKYHGRVKELAEGARKAGLKF
ncbi:50S ribosomal protein L18 [bacterium]|nr:50S ribosomal protein L18 [bacterium]